MKTNFARNVFALDIPGYCHKCSNLGCAACGSTYRGHALDYVEVLDERPARKSRPRRVTRLDSTRTVATNCTWGAYCFGTNCPGCHHSSDRCERHDLPVGLDDYCIYCLIWLICPDCSLEHVGGGDIEGRCDTCSDIHRIETLGLAFQADLDRQIVHERAALAGSYYRVNRRDCRRGRGRK